SAPIARTTAASMRPWYSHHDGVQIGSKELRDLRLREQDVRDRERTLERQASPNEVASLGERGVAIEHEDRGDDRERHPAGPAGDIAVRGDAVAVGRRLITGGGSPDARIQRAI